MNLTLWIIAGLLAAAFAAAGLMKLAQPKAQLAESGMAWTEDFSDGQVKGIGVVEVLGAIGPHPARGARHRADPDRLAAAGLVIAMLITTVVHARRGETSSIPIPLLLAALAAFVAVMRFGPHAF